MTATTVRAVLFDTFGTVVDWRSGIASAFDTVAARHSSRLDSVHLADAWRRRYAPSMQRITSGDRPYTDLDTLHRENLTSVLAEFELPFETSEADVYDLVHAWHELAPWPDSVPGLHALKAQYTIGPLSNGHTALLLEMAKSAGLPWDLIIGSDLTQAYKPDPAAYLRPAAILGLAPAEVMLVAAHNDDLRAARDSGLATAFVARPLEHGSDQSIDLEAESDWDVVADDIVHLAELLHPRLAR
ncbi:haloacid dehalogenase type II [Herbiconiux ginsengi]|uniref:2-haloacid dehalogenase n=1 Tax=Herbiconiux ginsengi TaxID=381665 RepID=A0A1H3TCU6_9MICO|nr:haloacid dehalogenase type II [Herbiconiux ginsengi]SDZ47708.1 2-haloacid dehalogenase [Herbiconiux ginsengi]